MPGLVPGISLSCRLGRAFARPNKHMSAALGLAESSAQPRKRPLMSAEARLKQLGLVLPNVPSPVANYLPFRLHGNLLFLSGQGPRDDKGGMLTGKVGSEVSVEEAYRRARLIGLQLLSAMRQAVGSLDRVEAVLKVLGMVNAVPEFRDQPKVINGCSDLFV